MVSPYALYLQLWINCFCGQGSKRGKTILRKQLDALAPQAETYLKQHKEADDATLCTDPQDASIASDA